MVRNQPVDVISVCSANGDIQPLRLRMEDEEHQLLRIDILEIISMKPLQFLGMISSRISTFVMGTSSSCLPLHLIRPPLEISRTGQSLFSLCHSSTGTVARMTVSPKALAYTGV